MITVEPFSVTTGKRSRPLTWSQLTVAPAFNDTGSWSVTCPATLNAQALASFDTDGTLKPFGVLVDWDGVWQFTGIAEEVATDRALGDDGTWTETITFSGADALVLLAQRIAYLDSTKAWGAQAVGTATKTGKAETVIKALITANCVSAGDSARNYPLLTVATDQGRGGAVSWSITTPDPSNTAVQATAGNTLMDIWRALAGQSTTPVGLRVDLIGTQLVVDCYEPRDLSDRAVFSAQLGNLADAALTAANPTANAILMQSDVTGAKFTETPGAGAGPWRRAEQFSDESSATAAADVTQAQADAVAQGAAQTSLASTAIDLPRLRFGPDAAGVTGYWLGDQVAVDLYASLTYSDQVTAVTASADLTQQPPTVSVVPSIGTTDSDTTMPAALQRQIDALQRKIRRAR